MPAISAIAIAPATYPATASPIRSSERRSRWRCSGGRMRRIASIHVLPLPSRNAVSTRIVISAKAELTMPNPTSRSVPAAPPRRPGSLPASFSSWLVMS